MFRFLARSIVVLASSVISCKSNFVVQSTVVLEGKFVFVGVSRRAAFVVLVCSVAVWSVFAGRLSSSTYQRFENQQPM